MSWRSRAGGTLRTFFLFYILSALSNPLIAILIILVIYLLVDRQFIGLLPDVFRPIRRRAKQRALRRTLAINPADADSHFELGSILVEERKWRQALPHLEIAVERLKNSQAHFQYGVALFRSGQEDEGKHHLEKALELNPKVGYGEPYLYLAEYALKRKQDVDAIPGFTEALELYSSTDVSYRLGRLFEQAGDIERARKMYQEASASYRGSPKFLRRRHRRSALNAWIRRLLLSSK